MGRKSVWFKTAAVNSRGARHFARLENGSGFGQWMVFQHQRVQAFL